MSKYVVSMEKPARWWGAMWREALPTGNGQIGAAVYGAVYDETIMVTHEELWWKGKTQQLPDVSGQLIEVRKQLLEGNPEDARWLMADGLKEEGYDPQMTSPLPLCDIQLQSPLDHGFTKYQRQLDMATGVVSVGYNDGDSRIRRDVFVSKSDGVIVCRITSSSKEAFKVHLSLDLHDRADALTKADNITLSSVENLEVYLPQNKQLTCKDQTLFFSAMNDDQTYFGAIAKVFAEETAYEPSRMTITGVGEILILVKPYIKSIGDKQALITENDLENLCGDYEALLERHTKLHTPLMKKASFDLYGEGHGLSNERLLAKSYTDETPTALLEKLWIYGRYLLISSGDNSSQPCHMYGLWCGEYQGMWAFNMLNENVQMIYWQALSGNLTASMLSMFDYYEGLMHDFRTNAKQLFGCRGIYIPAPTTPESGLLKLLLPHIIYWTGGAGWLAQHYYDYYAYTGDLVFLRERAMPFMEEAMAFYEDFLIIDEEGYYTMLPSNSPENTPGNYWASGGVYGTHKDMEVTINASMDFSIIKELLMNLIKAERILSIKAGQTQKWQGMLSKIPSYQLNEDNTVREWMHPLFEDNHHHRHLSHLYPLFPGTEVTKFSEPALYDAYAKTLNKRLAVGLKEQSGWSIAHMANAFARIEQGDQSLECLEILTRSCMLDNFYTTHNDWRGMGTTVDFPWAPIQLDANMGITAAMNEMVLRSNEGEISVLPALPKKWVKGKVTNLLARGPIEVSIEWQQEDGQIGLTLKALGQDQVIDVVVPDSATTCKEEKLVDHRLKKITLKANSPRTYRIW